MERQDKDMYELEYVRVQLIPDKVVLREKPLKSSFDAADFATQELSLNDREVFAVLNMNVMGQIINVHEVSIGDLCSSTTHPREVFKSSLLSNAGAIIAVHNHPSGDPTPSEADIATTERLCKAGEILGIPLLDHVIVGSGTKRCHSMRAAGEMDFDEM